MRAILLAYERDQDLAALETLLQSRGYRVLKARNGLEALEVTRNETPHAVVSDVLLPLLDGFALCRRLKEDPTTHHLPVLLLSFRVEGPKYEAFAAEVGALRFFPRGSTLEDLAGVLDSLKSGSDTMRMPALVPELLDRQNQDRRRVAELERQVRDLQHSNKLLGTAEKLARSKVEREARERADEVAAGSDKARELQQRIEELEAKLQSQATVESDKVRELQQRLQELEGQHQELSAVESRARDAAEESRASLARVGVLEGRLAELQSSRARAQATAADAERAFGAQPLPTLLSDMETLEIRAVSDSAAALFGIAPQELIGRPLADLLPGATPGDGGALPAELDRTRADGTRCVFQVRRASVSFSGRACWVTSLVDITSERALRDAEQLARAGSAALEAVPTAACVVNSDGRITYANAAFGVLMGIEPGKIEGMMLQRFETTEGEASVPGDAASAAAGAARRTTWRRPDGSSIDVEVASAALGDVADARIVAARDLTALRSVEERATRDRQLDSGLLELAQHTHMLTEAEVPVRALELARKATGAEAGYVFLSTADSGQLDLAAHGAAGQDQSQTLPVRWRGSVPAGTALAECVASQRVIERESAEGTGGLRQAGLPGSLHRQLATPIMDGGRLAGVVLLANKPAPFDSEDRRRAALVADGLWKALRRRRSDAEVVSAMDHMERVMLGAIEAIGTLSEVQDGCKAGRARRVGEMAAAIGTAMGLPGHSVRGLRVIGQLIDVGMLHIPREILWRTAPLSPPEFDLVRTHAERGYETLRRIDFPWPVAEAVRQHHERHDGSGYPRGLAGEEILVEARIVAVADAVEAMLSPRPQRQALSITACIDELQAQAGRRYDAAAARACVRLLRDRQAQSEPEARAGQRIA